MPSELLDAARDLASRPDTKTAGLWPRAAAMLARQALEQAVDELWLWKGLDLGQTSWTAKLLCVGEYLGDDELGAKAAQTWSALSAAYHHSPYELHPSGTQVSLWIEASTSFVHQLQASLEVPSVTSQADEASR